MELQSCGVLGAAHLVIMNGLSLITITPPASLSIYSAEIGRCVETISAVRFFGWNRKQSLYFFSFCSFLASLCWAKTSKHASVALPRRPCEDIIRNHQCGWSSNVAFRRICVSQSDSRYGAIHSDQQKCKGWMVYGRSKGRSALEPSQAWSLISFCACRIRSSSDGASVRGGAGLASRARN